MNQFQRGLLVTRRELRDSLSDWRIVLPVFLLTFLFPWVVIFVTKVGLPYAERYDPSLVLTRLIPYSMMAVGFFPITFSLVIALESFVGEKERNTLEALLSTPITDGALYVGKLLAGLVIPLTASLIAMGIYAFGLYWFVGHTVPAGLFLQIICLDLTLAVGMVAGAVVVSSNTTSVRAANLLASFIVLPSMLLVSFQTLVVLWEQPDALWLIAGAQVLADLGMIRMGIHLFNREELLARTVDRLDLRRAARTFGRFFLQEPAAGLDGPSAPFTLRRIYRRDLSQLLRRNAGAAGVVCLILVGAFVLGWLYAQALPLPPQTVEAWSLTPEAIRANWADFQGLLDRYVSPGRILGNNVGNLVLAALLGLVSFGAAAIIPLFVTTGLLGFLAGEAVILGLDVGQFSAFLWPHGVIEFPAAILLTAAGLRMGAAILAPKSGYTLGNVILQGLADLVKLLLFLVGPLLFLAALIEVYITPTVAFWFLGL